MTIHASYVMKRTKRQITSGSVESSAGKAEELDKEIAGVDRETFTPAKRIGVAPPMCGDTRRTFWGKGNENWDGEMDE